VHPHCRIEDELPDSFYFFLFLRKHSAILREPSYFLRAPS
jgi:hypothetical protein